MSKSWEGIITKLIRFFSLFKERKLFSEEIPITLQNYTFNKLSSN